jgi:hypothetical protein
MTSYTESIFDRPDLLDDTEPASTEATIYRATAVRNGKYWTATVHDLPDGQALEVRGGTWREVAHNGLDAVLELVDPVPHGTTIGFHLTPADQRAATALLAVSETRSARILAEQAERDAVRHAAGLLTGQGWTTRDIGSAIGLSHQRVSQIVSRATE